MKTRPIHLFLSAMMLVTIISCKKTNNEPGKPALVTITLTDNFIVDPFRAVIFVSGPDGSVLADTTCTANGSYVLYPQEGITIPSQFMLTIVSFELYWHGVKVHINTYSGVTPESSWTVKGSKPDTIGNISLTLTNVPSPPGAILYSTSGFSNLTFNPIARGAALYQSPDDLYVKIHSETGDIYKFVPGVAPGGNYTIDMADAAKASVKSIGLPFAAENYEADIYGYLDQGFDSPIPFMAEMLLSDGKGTNVINVSFPPSGFAGYHTRLMIQETYTSENTYFYSVDGAIPETFQKTGASVNSVATGRGTAGISTSGQFQMVTAQWIFVSHAFEFYDWNVYGSDTAHTVTLPRISPALSRLFPSLAIDSLSYNFTELTEFKTIGSYQELISKAFNPTHPQSFERFEASSVRRQN